jgi:uncharacterized protein YdeI (BOF family)
MQTIDETKASLSASDEAPLKTQRLRKGPAILAGVMIAAGALIGAGAVGLTRPSIQMAPTSPVAISSLPTEGIVTVKGKVAEIYGNKFIVADSSGRALIETGRAGEDQKLVVPDETVSVQGRLENGFIHATYLIRSSGEVHALSPPPPPPPHDWLHRMIGPR